MKESIASEMKKDTAMITRRVATVCILAVSAALAALQSSKPGTPMTALHHLWERTSTSIFPTNPGWSVGIGNQSPQATLDVTGSVLISGTVGIGTADPSEPLSVAGVVESETGGFKFPDGTIQASATRLPWSDVTDFGAIAGDDLNDQAAFDAALQDAGPGGTVYVPATKPEGTAFLVDSIELVRGQSLIGAGRLFSVVRAYTHGSGAGVRRSANAAVTSTNHVAGIGLHDFEYGIDARGIYESHFEDIDLAGNGINILLGNEPGQSAGSLLLAFERVKMSGALVRDLQVWCDNAAPVNGNTFSNCQFESTGSQPFFVGCGGNGLASNQFVGNDFWLGITLAGAASVTLHSNYFEGGDKQIEFMGSVLGASIVGNYFHDWGEAAVWMGCNGTRGVMISGNSFWAGPGDGPAIKVANTGGCTCEAIRVLANDYENVGVEVEDPKGCVVKL